MTAANRVILTTCFILSFAYGHTQQFLPDSVAGRMAADQAIKDYRGFVGTQARVYNGVEQIGYLPLIGHPYFQEQAVTIGQLVFEGVSYRSMPMLYDIVKDQVIVLDSSGNQIGLSGYLIKEFDLQGHHFIQTDHGFCDVLYDGPVSIFCKRRKVIEESIENIKVIRTVYEHDRYYFVENGVYHPFSNMRSLLKLLKNGRKDILKDLRSKGIKYKKTPELAYIEAADYYHHHSLAN
jgi:hypothetical protein